MAGLFFGFAFGMGGIGAAVLGQVADAFGIRLVYEICAFLPIIGLLAGLLPDIDGGTGAAIAHSPAHSPASSPAASGPRR